jgi:hypothetical protein
VVAEEFGAPLADEFIAIGAVEKEQANGTAVGSQVLPRPQRSDSSQRPLDKERSLPLGAACILKCRRSSFFRVPESRGLLKSHLYVLGNSTAFIC